MNYDFPKIEGIDWEIAYHYVPDSETLHETLIEIVKSSSKQVGELLACRDTVESTPDADSFAAYRICAHAMKSALRSIGSDLFTQAYELECAGQNKDRETIAEKTEPFTENYISLANKLKTITGDVDVAVAYDETIFNETIDEIRAAMEAFDINTLQEALGRIQDMETPSGLKEELKRLEEAIIYLDPDQVMASCAALKQEGMS